MYDILKLLKVENLKRKIDDIIHYFSSLPIYIYGAGNAGKNTYELFKLLNVDINGFIDRKAEDNPIYLNKIVIDSNDEVIHQNINLESIIIIGYLCNYDEIEKIKKRFLKLGYRKFYYFHEIYNIVSLKNYIDNISNYYSTNNNAFKLEKEKLIDAYKLLDEDKSKNIYANYIKSMFELDFQNFINSVDEHQYFVKDIELSKGYSRFIDCGAFIGDTALELNKFHGIIDKIALFEPDTRNFEMLRNNINKVKVAKEQILFPCGTWKESKVLKFTSGIQGSSNISDTGDSYVQCVAIDDVIPDFAPTFIKMDIEGAEYEALQGAEKTIKKYTPDLAISVYHKIEDIWRIPLLIKKFNPHYKFYLRAHGIYGMETILYCVCEEDKKN